MEDLLALLEREFRDDPRFRMAFHPVGQWGGSNDANLETCGRDESKTLIEQMKAVAFKRGLGIFTIKDANAFGGQVCYAARPYNLVVGATGKVMKCTVVLDKNPRNIVGQITEEGLLPLDDDNMALWTEPAFQRDSQCQKCVALPACQGISCPLPRIVEDQRPCVATRTMAKDELREMLLYAPFHSKVAGAAAKP
jgi:uncharacterized protein